MGTMLCSLVLVSKRNPKIESGVCALLQAFVSNPHKHLQNMDRTCAYLYMMIAAMIYCCTAVSADQQKPNIMLILADDFGWGNLGYHRRGEDASEQAKKEAHTPNLDGLIDEGIYLSRHYAYKICSPSRSSLQSGRLAVHVNTENTAPSVYNSSDPVSGYAGIPRNMTGIAEKMKEGGYATAMVGSAVVANGVIC